MVNDDLFLSSIEAGSAGGFRVKTLPDRIGPLNPSQSEYLGLSSLQQKLTAQAGRPVEFMLLDNLQGAMSGPSHVVKFGNQ